jgi:hypothetical protein
MTTGTLAPANDCWAGRARSVGKTRRAVPDRALRQYFACFCSRSPTATAVARRHNPDTGSPTAAKDRPVQPRTPGKAD